MGRRNVDNERLVVGMDTRDRRQRKSRCLTSALLFVLFVVALAFCHHLGYPPHRPHPHPHPHPPRVPWDGPRKIVIQESKALIMLGWGKADLVSQVILETAPVQHITLHVLQAEVSQPKSSSDPMDCRRQGGPVLQFKVATILDSKLVTFYIPEDDPEDSGRLTIKIQVPDGFDGSLIIQGSFLNIRGSTAAQSFLGWHWHWHWHWHWPWQRQRQVRFSELSLTTDEGSIDLHGGLTRAAVFKAVVKRRGDIHTGTLEEAVLGGGFEAVVQSAVGLVSLDARMTRSMEWPTGGYHIKAVAGQGRLHLNVQEDKAIAIGERGGRGVPPGLLRIEAESKDGEMDARVELMDGQALQLDAESADGAIVKLSDKYSGKFSAASTNGEAMVVPKEESESVIHYHRLGRKERRGVKYPAGAEGLKDIVGDHVLVTGAGATQIIFV
ncbi:hypothetical protein KVV02_001586 [Mortierella alpina]|uniref:Uncharacterized protein n=1 Tax=Mortierella alpina TaxID=64518 RepID=A0A9P8A903_MORAP|nr:hypothetical protein KVV02_001586 [Mortierella alpina]